MYINGCIYDSVLLRATLYMTPLTKQHPDTIEQVSCQIDARVIECFQSQTHISR